MLLTSTLRMQQKTKKMKNFTFTVFSLLLITVQGQDFNTTSGGFNRGSRLISLTVGHTLEKRNLMNDAKMALGETTGRVIGAFGLTYEKVLSKKVGVGPEISFSNIHSTNTIPRYSLFNNASLMNETTRNVLHGFLRFNYYFTDGIANFTQLNMQNFEWYIYAGVGIRVAREYYYTNNPYDARSTGYTNSFSLAGKGGLGLRYLFTQRTAFATEIGIGRPYASIRIVQKISR